MPGGEVQVLARATDETVRLNGVPTGQGKLVIIPRAQSVRQQTAMQIGQFHPATGRRSSGKDSSHVLRTPRPSILRRMGQ